MRTRSRIISIAILVAALSIFPTYLLWPRPKAMPLYRVTVLSSLGGSNINGDGYMAGWQSFPGGRRRMVLWRSGGLPKVLFPVDYEIQRCGAINDANQVLFTEWHHHVLDSVAPGRLLPFLVENYLWDPNLGRIALDPLVRTKRGEIVELFGLNNGGCIVGRVTGHDWTGRITYVHPLLLEPIPERWRKGSARQETQTPGGDDPGRGNGTP